MKIGKVFHKFFQTMQLNKVKKSIPPCPIVYNRNNVTSEEFREYVHWLSQNEINKTFYEPDKFITQIERMALEKRKAKLKEYQKFIKNLSDNNINKTFYC